MPRGILFINPLFDFKIYISLVDLAGNGLHYAEVTGLKIGRKLVMKVYEK